MRLGLRPGHVGRLTAWFANRDHSFGTTNASKSVIPVTATSPANFHPNSFTCLSGQGHHDTGNTGGGHTSWLMLTAKKGMRVEFGRPWSVATYASIATFAPRNLSSSPATFLDFSASSKPSTIREKLAMYLSRVLPKSRTIKMSMNEEELDKIHESPTFLA